MKKTVAQIVQELLDKQALSAEDAVILLTKEKEYIMQPYWHYYNYPWHQGGTITWLGGVQSVTTTN